MIVVNARNHKHALYLHLENKRKETIIELWKYKLKKDIKKTLSYENHKTKLIQTYLLNIEWWIKSKKETLILYEKLDAQSYGENKENEIILLLEKIIEHTITLIIVWKTQKQNPRLWWSAGNKFCR